MLVKIEGKQNQNEKLKMSKAELKCETDELFEEKGFECRNGTNCSMQYMKKKQNKKKTNKQTRSGVLQYEHRADGGFILLDWSRNMRGEVRGRELNAI